jgi:hypothetical protein
MWKVLNSPIVVCLVVVLALIGLRSSMKPKLAGEIRGVYDELMKIAEDGASDAEKSKAIQRFAQEVSRQLKTGFKEGFSSASDGKVRQDQDLEFLEVRKQVEIVGFKYIKSNWPNREQFLFKIKNNSDKYLTSLKVNYEFYKGTELVDCKNEWVSQIKILEPGQEFAVSENRQFPRGTKPEDEALFKSDTVKISISSFTVKDVKPGDK